MSKVTKTQTKTDASPPPSGRPPSGNLASREAKRLAAELSNYYAEYAPLFARREQREWAQLYMRGQLSDTDDMISIFTAILIGGDANKRLAAKLIRKLSPAARRDLRAACQDLDNLIDDVWLEELRERRPWKL